MNEQFATLEETTIRTGYHIEIDRDTSYVSLQNRANLYLEERVHLDVAIHSVQLQWIEGQYHLTMVVTVPIDEALA